MTAACSNLVMVIEDDRDVRESITEVLEDHEYRAIAAENGQDAIAQLGIAATLPCVILLDVMMPIMDGWQFRALQQQSPALSGIPVVILTAHANVGEAAAGMQAAGFLRKPLQLSALLSIVERFCER